MVRNNLRILLYLLLVLLLFSRLEARPIHDQLSNERRITSLSLIERAKEVLSESMKRQEMIGGFNQSLRRSPGGPDPRHH
ncbi:hypothetical protein MANES_03G103300v8 [Manihot esculenta]|uniref:Uncharacterized protein n=1 Tax=Manihot esculenta TaxID=3983 RepID=A0A2C9W8C4_MANES|nr:hypothetical protein MANES_03G103300v8 [Manihot esculenta]